MSGWMIVGAVLALALGVWIGLGAPGWPWKPEPSNRRLEKRNINPIAWGRSGIRERMQVRDPDERRRPRLR